MVAAIITVLVMALFLANGAFAHMDDSPGKMGSGGKYEMMNPGGEGAKGQGMVEGSEEVCPLEGKMGYGRHMYGGHGYSSHMAGGYKYGGHLHWMFIGFGLLKVGVLGLFFWLLFRIAKALEKIAAGKSEEMQGA